jgi:hypothetical protein
MTAPMVGVCRGVMSRRGAAGCAWPDGRIGRHRGAGGARLSLALLVEREADGVLRGVKTHASGCALWSGAI